MKYKNTKHGYAVRGIFVLLFILAPFLAQTAHASTSYGFTDMTSGTKASGYSQSECNQELASLRKAFPLDIFTDCAQVTDAPLTPPPTTTPTTINPIVVPVAPATAPSSVVTSVYNLLAPIGTLTQVQTNDIGGYLNTIFKIGIGLCGALAVIMIVIASIQYMGDESIFGKTEAKSKILSAILGLLIALGAYALLNTISPSLTGANGVTVDQVTADIGGDTNAPIGSTQSLPSGIVCSGGKANIPSIAASFNGKMTYSQDIPKGQAGPNSTIKLDCSGFANYVLKCAGVPFTNSGSADIFSGAEKVTTMTDTSVNGKALQIGDLIGWTPSDDSKGNGHVMIYVGNGTVNDSHGPATPVKPGQAYGSFPTTKYQSRIKYVKRAS